MAFIDDQLVKFKELVETSIIERGSEGKQSMICSKQPINLIHDAVKYDLIKNGVEKTQVFPPFGESTPEMKVTGFIKQKNQDVCVQPANIAKKKTSIIWGPMSALGKSDEYGYTFSDNTLIINIRSQMSSLAKNVDTMLERTTAESLNLHLRYPNMVLGEVFLIPVYEYDDHAASEHQVAFKKQRSDVETYINFFNSINGHMPGYAEYIYERCALLIVDFSKDKPKLYRTNEELALDGIISPDFAIDYSKIDFDHFASDLLEIYGFRYDIDNLLTKTDKRG